MEIRTYQKADAAALADLFYETVHSINARDYTPQQLDAWAPKARDLAAWHRSFLAHPAVVAWEGEHIVGFGDMNLQGYFDRLYVHKDYQRRGIASAIAETLERTVPVSVYTVHASETAKLFFARRGYRVLRAQQVKRYGVLLQNYVMEKRK